MQNDENKVSTEVEVEQESHSADGDYQVNKKGFHSVVAKVICVLLAVVLWFYVVGNDTAIEEKRFSDVSVDIVGLDVLEEDYELSIISGYNHTVDITLTGANSDISRLTIDKIDAFVDVSEITAAGEYSLEIQTDLPNGVTVSSQSSNYIQVYIDKRTSVSVPVQVEPIYSMEAAYTMGDPIPSIQSVNVSGPAVELEKIAYAKVSLDLGRIDKSLTATGKLVLVDALGSEITNQYIRMQTTEISVKIPVYTYKDVPLAVDYKYGYFNESNVDIKISPASIRIKGEPDELASIDKIVILQLDEKRIVGNTTQTASIMLPDDVENLSGIRTADITVTHKGTETRAMLVTNLRVVNPSNLSYELASPEIAVQFRGTRTLLSLLSQNNVTATIDLGYLNNTKGTFSVPVTVSVSSTLSGSVYEIGEYKIDVTIN